MRGDSDKASRLILTATDPKSHLLDRFSDWCRTNSIHLHHGLKIFQEEPDEPEVSITLKCTIRFSESNTTAVIPTRISVASIPKKVCFSHRNSSLSNLHIETTAPGFGQGEDLEHHPSLRLAYHLAHEITTVGSKSFWSPYLELIMLNEYQPDLIHHQFDRVVDLRKWLRGTEIERLVDSGQAISIDRLHQKFHNFKNLYQVVRYRGGSDSHSLDWETFRMAYVIVLSRAFYIDNFHTLALVPIADLFDHSDEPDVVMISDDIVCDRCGAHDECDHEIDDNKLKAGKTLVKDSDHDDGTVELECIRPLAFQRTFDDYSSPTPVIYNTYGNLSNARLLTEYGFMIEANLHEKLYFEPEDLMIPVEGLPKGILNKLRYIRDNELVSTSFQSDLEGEHYYSKIFYIDSSAKLSPLLWIGIVLNRNSNGHQKEYHKINLSLLLKFQIKLYDENENEAEGCDEAFERKDMSLIVQKLCRSRLERYFRAIDYLVSERILIETCLNRWIDLEKKL
ncbi:hypothetical protein BY996DRAFT_6531963 [Phakopsora pachyrhizi]|nr:hypothetical protein BY996DRAFT_6531963 [Phakopsora pachyrhizi]